MKENAQGSALPRASLLVRLEKQLLRSGIFIAPFASLHPSFINVTLSDLLLFAALLLKTGFSRIHQPLGSYTTVWLLGLLTLVVGLMVSSLAAGDPSRGLVVSSQYLFAYLVLPLAIAGRSRDDANRLMVYWVTGMVLMCTIGIVIYLSGYRGGYSKHFLIVSGGGRLTAFVDNPNGLAAMISCTVPILIYSSLNKQISKAAFLYCIAVLIISLVLTSSNTGIITTVITVSVFMILRGAPGPLLVMAISIAGTFLVITQWGDQILPVTFQRRVLPAFSSGEISEAGTFEDRMGLMTEAVGMLDRHILLGLGADGYRDVSAFRLPVHNTYLLLWTEGGLLAALGWMALMLTALCAGFQSFSRTKRPLLSVAVLASTVNLLAIAMMVSHFYARALVLPLLLLLVPLTATLAVERASGVMAATHRRDQKRQIAGAEVTRSSQ